jgi:hypothetical protein
MVVDYLNTRIIFDESILSVVLTLLFFLAQPEKPYLLGNYDWCATLVDTIGIKQAAVLLPPPHISKLRNAAL